MKSDWFGRRESRREFLRDAAAFAGAASLAGESAMAALNADAGANAAGIPTRTLGRAKEKVTILGLGTAPVGLSKPGADKGVAVYRAALEAGVNYVDTAHGYDAAEGYLGELMPAWRDRIFLATKSLPQSDNPRDGAREMQEQFEESLRSLKTTYVDLLHIHSIGDKPPEYILAGGGPLEFAAKMRDKGLARFIGVTGHNYVPRFAKVIESGAIDAVMVTLNFVDFHRYAFEETLLPVARRRGCGILAMKVFGGHSKGPPGYRTAGPSMMPAGLHEKALRYSLGITDLASAVIGAYSVEEILQTVEWAKRFRPMESAERDALREQGKQLVDAWGLRFGPPA